MVVADFCYRKAKRGEVVRQVSEVARKPQPKRHHFVPKFVSENFASAGGAVSVLLRADGEIRDIMPRDLFVAGHLYSTVERDGSRDAALEVALGRFEGGVSPIIRMIIDNQRNGADINLDMAQKRFLDQFIYLQFKRVPDRYEVDKLSDEFNRILRRSIVEWVQENPERADEVEGLDYQKTAEIIFQNARIEAIRDGRGLALPEMARRGIDVIQILPPVNAQFVLGSNPVVGVMGLLDEGVSQLWMPIAPDIAIGLGPIGNEIRQAGCLDRDAIDRFNGTVAAQSTRVASRSRGLLETYRDRLSAANLSYAT